MAELDERDEELKSVIPTLISKRLIFIGGGILLLLIVIASCLTYVKHKRIEEANVVPIVQEPTIIEVFDADNVLTGASYRLEPFVINLNKGSGVLKIRVALVFFELELPQQFDLSIPKFRDLIITEASTFTADDLVRHKNRIQLKNRIKERINNDELIGLEVVDVLFEEFTVL